MLCELIVTLNFLRTNIAYPNGVVLLAYPKGGALPFPQSNVALHC